MGQQRRQTVRSYAQKPVRQPQLTARADRMRKLTRGFDREERAAHYQLLTKGIYLTEWTNQQGKLVWGYRFPKGNMEYDPGVNIIDLVKQIEEGKHRDLLFGWR